MAPSAAVLTLPAAPRNRYEPSANASVTNTGHTLQVNLQPGSNSISWAGQQLELLQYHFHTPSEHTVEGAASAMEAHLVHRNTATGVWERLVFVKQCGIHSGCAARSSSWGSRAV